MGFKSRGLSLEVIATNLTEYMLKFKFVVFLGWLGTVCTTLHTNTQLQIMKIKVCAFWYYLGQKEVRVELVK